MQVICVYALMYCSHCMPDTFPCYIFQEYISSVRPSTIFSFFYECVFIFFLSFYRLWVFVLYSVKVDGCRLQESCVCMNLFFFTFRNRIFSCKNYIPECDLKGKIFTPEYTSFWNHVIEYNTICHSYFYFFVLVFVIFYHDQQSLLSSAVDFPLYCVFQFVPHIHTLRQDKGLDSLAWLTEDCDVLVSGYYPYPRLILVCALSPNNPNTLHDCGSEERGERERERTGKKGLSNSVFEVKPFFFFSSSWFFIFHSYQIGSYGIDFVVCLKVMRKNPSSLFCRERGMENQTRICL